MPKARKNIHVVIKEQTDLAKIYAEDGAFYTAAKIFQELSEKVHEHAEWCELGIRKVPRKKQA